MIQITRMVLAVNTEFKMIDKTNLQSGGIIKKPCKSMNLKKVRDIKYNISIKETKNLYQGSVFQYTKYFFRL